MIPNLLLLQISAFLFFPFEALAEKSCSYFGCKIDPEIDFLDNEGKLVWKIDYIYRSFDAKLSENSKEIIEEVDLTKVNYTPEIDDPDLSCLLMLISNRDKTAIHRHYYALGATFNLPFDQGEPTIEHFSDGIGPFELLKGTFYDVVTLFLKKASYYPEASCPSVLLPTTSGKSFASIYPQSTLLLACHFNYGNHFG